ncbi:MAG: hypothetical protein MZW92_12275 [Comamonadaceae bacterium]|nr:hypothetical protein [Comamonadaceae bacterium]
MFFTGSSALGAVLYELLSGAPPFAGGTATDVIVAVLTRDPPRLTGVPQPVADIVGRALQKERAHRYPTAAALLDDLTSAKQALGGGAGRPAPDASRPRRCATAEPRWAARWPRRARSRRSRCCRSPT